MFCNPDRENDIKVPEEVWNQILDGKKLGQETLSFRGDGSYSLGGMEKYMAAKQNTLHRMNFRKPTIQILPFSIT